MSNVFVDISVSIDGFIAGPNPSREHPLGEGGEELHEWVVKLAKWRETHGKPGGEKGAADELLDAVFERIGAVVMGRGMFGPDEGPWGDEPWEGWWGDEPPFAGPVFVVTNYAREPLVKGRTTFHFVTDGVGTAIEMALDAAGQKDVSLAGGASVIQQGLQLGAVHDVALHLIPIVLGGGVRLLEGIDPAQWQIESVLDLPEATHVKYRVH